MLVNPYIVDRPLNEDDLFRGREAAFARLFAELRRGQRLLLLYGRPRIGKTSFLNQLPSRLGEQYAVHRIDWQALSLAGQSPLDRIASGVSKVTGARSSAGRLSTAPVSPVPVEGDGSSRKAPAASASDETTHLVCFDGIPASELTSHPVMQRFQCIGFHLLPEVVLGLDKRRPQQIAVVLQTLFWPGRRRLFGCVACCWSRHQPPPLVMDDRLCEPAQFAGLYNVGGA